MPPSDGRDPTRRPTTTSNPPEPLQSQNSGGATSSRALPTPAPSIATPRPLARPHTYLAFVSQKGIPIETALRIYPHDGGYTQFEESALAAKLATVDLEGDGVEEGVDKSAKKLLDGYWLDDDDDDADWQGIL
ncbi:hypothetical protein QJS10_CPB11g00970 [Acorus calamus]|uniref:Uncharacterized protein n=1 Tax=Acorus calamus TaxID=4465 RepID=A0AAV9DVZ9_ACOCL|nr:hypothetical protein QJS10_CPB11g00970 [Acorus calamus]